MAILLMHSFDYNTNLDHYSDLEQYNNHSTIFISTTHARTGTQSLRMSGTGFYGASAPTWLLGTRTTTAWIQHAAWYDHNPAGSGDLYHLYFHGDTEVMIGFTYTDRSMAAYRNGTLIATSPNSELLPLNQWFFMEATVVLHASAGSVLVKINGVTVLDASGLNTGTPGYFDRIRMRPQLYDSGNVWVDDLIVGNNVGPNNTSPPGDARVEYLLPIGAGSKTEFTPLSGSNWGNVDESAAFNDADYNSSPDTGATDLFAMSNLSGNGLVHGVRSILRARKDDAGYRKIRPEFYKSDGTGNTPRLYGGLDQAVGDTFGYTRQIFELSPDTGVAWTVEEIADLQYGYSVGGGSQFGVDAWIAEFIP